MAKRTVESGPTITFERVQKYELLSAHLNSLQQELREIAKKKPEGVLNANKVERINRVLKDIRELLQGEPGLEYLDLIDESGVPQYSDAVLLLGQFSVGLSRFQAKYRYKDDPDDVLSNSEWHLADE